MIRDADRSFYERIAPTFCGINFALPEPVQCPLCRWRQRLAFRNERTLYHRRSDKSGRQMISTYPEGTVFPVYYIDEWLSDDWDARSYGRDFDFSRPFFPQLAELTSVVPHRNLFVYPPFDHNSEYTNCADHSKNCYLISQATENEDCYYCRGINHCRSCADCLRIDNCELCYECINAGGCYNCRFCQDLDNCTDCSFSSNLRACRNCFGCHNLLQKEYCFFNQPLSREQWQRTVERVPLRANTVRQLAAKSEELRLNMPHCFARMIHCDNAAGDHIKNCRDAYYVFDSHELEQCAYCFEVQDGARFCWDYSMWGVNAELLYNCNACGSNAYNLLFCNHCSQGAADLIYCDSCYPGCRSCFGCFGLQRREHCILNKQYSKEDYEKTAAKIITHMQRTGEWGGFFPMQLASYPYNDTVAFDYFPLERGEAAREGLVWSNPVGSEVEGAAERVSEDASAEDSALAGAVFCCPETGRRFRLLKPELELYRKLAIPVPQLHPDRRHALRMSKRNPCFLWRRNCARCAKPMETAYAPQRPETVVCENCYLQGR